MHNRQEAIKAKGFNIVQGSREINYHEGDTGYHQLTTSGIPAIDFNKIKVGTKVLDDVILNLGSYTKINARLANKENILRAINNYNLKAMRKISDFFYKTNGIYARILRYMAFMYRYDWIVTPYINDESLKKDKY